MNRLRDELERVHRNSDYAVAVVMLDLDHFKAVNDSYGHGVGDKVLQNVAAILNDEIRKVDLVGRLGGEEFGLLLTGTSEEMALLFTNRIRKRIQDTPLSIEQAVIVCTASIGITQISSLDSDIELILERADKALYLAKDLGRNRVEIYHSDAG